jgi:hypothetical protein
VWRRSARRSTQGPPAPIRPVESQPLPAVPRLDAQPDLQPLWLAGCVPADRLTDATRLVLDHLTADDLRPGPRGPVDVPQLRRRPKSSTASTGTATMRSSIQSARRSGTAAAAAVRHDVAVTPLDVRRLAALDMHGLAGTQLRRRVIVAEFVLGAVGCVVIGLLTAARAPDAGWRVLGVGLVGSGVNYLVLALHAISLLRAGALDAELASVDVASELRRYTYLQVWIVVPLLLVVLGVLQLRGRPAADRPD